jgi:hypothetical protein
MNSRLFACSLGLLLVCSGGTALATEVGTTRPLGFGAALGTPASLVAKYFVSRENAWDFGLGFWSFGRGCDDGVCGGGALSLNVDYLWQDAVVAGKGASLDWHIGGGGRLWAGGDDFALAGRMPVGFDLTFNRPSFLEVFLEIAPALYIVPNVGLDVEALLGIRLYP